MSDFLGPKYTNTPNPKIPQGAESAITPNLYTPFMPPAGDKFKESKRPCPLFSFQNGRVVFLEGSSSKRALHVQDRKMHMFQCR